MKKYLFICGLLGGAAWAGAAQDSADVAGQVLPASGSAAQAFLPLSQATLIVDAVEAAAVSRGLKLVISIVDAHGNLKIFRRMDGSSSGSVQVSIDKALTSARFPVSTRALAARSNDLPANPYASIPGFLLLGGGLPLFDLSKSHIGGIGVSGATPELDEICAQAGVDLLLEPINSTRAES